MKTRFTIIALMAAVAVCSCTSRKTSSIWADQDMWYMPANEKNPDNIDVLDLLRHMTDEQYSSMIACYTIGYRLSDSDLKHPHIKAAEKADDCGVVISFNSSMTRDAVWPLVSEGSVTCINPVNWTTDSTPAEFHFDGTTNTVSVDPETQILLVQTDKPEYFHDFYELAPFFLDAGVKQDNLHHWDLLFYSSQIHDNALLRAESR